MCPFVDFLFFITILAEKSQGCFLPGKKLCCMFYFNRNLIDGIKACVDHYYFNEVHTTSVCRIYSSSSSAAVNGALAFWETKCFL